MSFPNAGCCSVTLNQQRQSACQQYQQSCNPSSEQPSKPVVPVSKNCTVVENGRVVVKPRLIEPPVEASADSDQPET
ncbi:MAG TPA: hypothetical protein V6C57_21205 [Coleofasciculaceae cyanobacterium]